LPHIRLLAQCLGADHPAPAHGDAVGEDPGRAGHLVADHLHHFGDSPLVERLTLLDEDQQLVEHGPRPFHIRLRAGEDHLVPARDKTDLGKEVFHLSQMSVRLSDQFEEQVMAGYA
jgi:hypothetical protein